MYVLSAHYIALMNVYHLFICLLSELKLILNHQERRSLPNVDMVKFRAFLGEASLHKKGTCSVSLRVPSQHREIGTKQITLISKNVQAAHADILRFVTTFSCKPDWINIIVWIDSFFELRCCGAMSTFWRVRLSWWFSIIFSRYGAKKLSQRDYINRLKLRFFHSSKGAEKETCGCRWQ
jgi:hypothetical protein